LAAVKIINKLSPLNKDLSYVGDSETKKASFQRAVQREIVIMKLLDHPNVLKLYDLWENRDQLYAIYLKLAFY
jgi:serine/threonine-protein kinase HSL1, negative regulator of Swe1 kinase